MKMSDLLTVLRNAVAEFGGNKPIADLPTGPLPDDGYSRTAPGPIGAAKQSLVIEETPNGVKLSLVQKDGTPDYHRRKQQAMYARLKREREQLSDTETQ